MQSNLNLTTPKTSSRYLEKFNNIIKLIRPKHYVKNGLVFVSIFFTLNLFSLYYINKTILGFLAFCSISSVVYIINDIKDVNADRLHEIKKNRPIASGKVSIIEAEFIIVILMIISIACNYLAAGFNESILLLFAYLLLNIFYSFGLKKVPLIDVLILVSGFLIRVLYGAVIINSGVSSWVYLTVMSVSFYLGLGKRRNELLKLKEEAVNTRGVLKYYNHAFLDKNMYMSMALAIVFYSLWSADNDIILKYNTDKLVFTVPIVIFLAMKYSLDIERGTYGDPVEVILGDKLLLITAAIYIMIIIGIIYGSTIINYIL